MGGTQVEITVIKEVRMSIVEAWQWLQSERAKSPNGRLATIKWLRYNQVILTYVTDSIRNYSAVWTVTKLRETSVSLMMQYMVPKDNPLPPSVIINTSIKTPAQLQRTIWNYAPL